MILICQVCRQTVRFGDHVRRSQSEVAVASEDETVLMDNGLELHASHSHDTAEHRMDVFCECGRMEYIWRKPCFFEGCGYTGTNVELVKGL